MKNDGIFKGNKLTQKFGEEGKEGMARVLWWVNKTNELYKMRRPSCLIPFDYKRNIINRIRALIIHVFVCKYKPNPPHKVGYEVEEKYLSRYESENLKKESHQIFGSAE